MAILPKCPSCNRLGRYAKSEKSKVCAKCYQEGKAQDIKLTKKE